MKALQKYPFFLFLLAIFFCLHGYVENYELVFVKSLFITFFYTLAFVLLLFIFCNVLFKQKQVAALASFCLGVYVLFFGAFFDFVKGIPSFSWLHAYKFFIPISLVLIVFLIFFVKRSENYRVKLFSFFNLLLIVFCTYDAVLISLKLKAKGDAIGLTKIEIPAKQNKPNIYLLLFDEYPGYKSLENDFNFKNDFFYDSLKVNGFQFLPTSSNYNSTFFSVASLLNMQYVNNTYDSLIITAKEDFKRLVEIKNNKVTKTFKDIGYDINNLSIFDIGEIPSPYFNFFVKTNTDLITNKILHKRVFKDIGLQMLSNSDKYNSLLESYFLQNEVSNKNIEEEIQLISANNKNVPHFTYAHFLMPHFPYYFDSLGNKMNTKIVVDEKSLYNKIYFISYLKYVNTAILKMTNQIISKDSSAILIIISDHGFRNNTDSNLHASQFNNICAIRFPNTLKQDFSNIKSNVNLFPLLFNRLFNQKMPILPDSSIFLKEKG